MSNPDAASTPATPASSGESDGATTDGWELGPIRSGPILMRFAVVLIGIVIGFALVDRVVAWLDSEEGVGGSGSVTPDLHLGWTTRPGFVNPEFQTTLDRFGNRNPEIPEDAPLDEVRIAGFGASRIYGAEGAQQPRVWNYELERALAKTATPARVLNGAVIGYSGTQAAERAMRIAPLIEADLVFMLVSPRGQMLLDPHGTLEWAQYGGPTELIPADVVEAWPRSLWPQVASVHFVLAEHSAIYRRKRARFSAEQGMSPDLEEQIQTWCLSRKEQPAVIQERIDRSLDRLQQLARKVEASGAEFRALVMPEPFMDKPVRWENWLRGNQGSLAPPLGTPRSEPVDVLIEMLDERGIQSWNFFEEGNEMGRGGTRFYMDPQGHWSHDGHMLIARGIYKRLVDTGLLTELAERRAANPRTEPFGDPSLAVFAPGGSEQ